VFSFTEVVLMNLAGIRSTAVFIPDPVPLSPLVASDSAADDVTMPSMQYGSLNPDPQMYRLY